ncbi:MAG: hypothetical protein U9N50_09625 [Pseudomonadota bacterium]|nr:hypothetical protein [Pseudomonadota bacterium]
MNTTLKVKIRQFNTETQERLMELLNMLFDRLKPQPEADDWLTSQISGS